MIRTRVTSRSSSAQPVTGIEPATPDTPSDGVSNDPNGAVACGARTRASVAVTVLLVFDAPVYVSVTLAVCVVNILPKGCTEIDSDAEPLPDAGLTTSHGAEETAVHVGVPSPFCVSRTVCAEVCDVNVPPPTAAQKRIDVVSIVIDGGAGRCVITKACPPIVSVTVRAAHNGFAAIV